VSNLYVEATLIRRDTHQESQSLDGTTLIRVWNGLATFRKLKITSTSQQAGTFFLLKFSLKRYDMATFIVRLFLLLLADLPSPFSLKVRCGVGREKWTQPINMCI
jgi:hypothetical protein